MNQEFDYDRSVADFISIKNIDRYKQCMNVFKGYLIEKKVLSVLRTYFQGIRSDDLVDSLEYYVVHNNVTSFGAANVYAACIQEYFKFIIARGLVKNDELMAEFAYPIDDKKSCRNKINSYLSKEPRIKASMQFEPVTEEEAKDIIDECNLIIERLNNIEKVTRTQKDYNKLRSSIILKIMLLTGITYRCLIKIKVDSLDLKHGQITINGLTFHLPNKLIDDLVFYKDVREKIVNESNNTQTLFVESSGCEISELTSTTSGFLCTLTGRKDLNGVIKYGIINLIRNGVNQSIIEKLTEVGKSIYNDCQKQVNSTMDYKASRYLDSKIRDINIFDLL